MRKNRGVEQNRCCHLVSRRAHRAFFLTDDGQNRAVALMPRAEAGVQAGMSYCIDRAVAISADPLSPLFKQEYAGTFKSGGIYTGGWQGSIKGVEVGLTLSWDKKEYYTLSGIVEVVQVHIGKGNIPKNKPFTDGYGRGVPTLRIGNGKPSVWNHFDLRLWGY